MTLSKNKAQDDLRQSTLRAHSAESIRERVAALSPTQRAALFQKLSAENSPPQPQLSSAPQRLIAYVVPTADSVVEATHLKAAIKAKLPQYMVPTAITVLPQLPRTDNGKIDVRSLPTPAFGSASCSTGYLAADIDAAEHSPKTLEEQTLAEIWKTVLRVDRLGIHDNFFELGGDSILSIQIVSRAREAGLRLAPNQLFDHPTVAELAAAVNVVPRVESTQTVVTGNVPLTPIQRWFFAQEMAAAQHWHQAMLFELPVGVEAEQVKGAIAALYRHHDALRMRFVRNDQSSGGWEQINADVDVLPELVEVDISKFDEDKQRESVANCGTALHSRTSLSVGSLLNAAYFKRGQNSSDWLLVGVHHLVVDIVSWQILQDDLQRLLLAEPAGQLPETSQLPEKTTAFKDWAKLLVTHTDKKKHELPFWVSQLEATSARLPQDTVSQLPTTEKDVNTVTVALGVDDTADLLHRVPAVYGTRINDVLLTALSDTLLSWVNSGANECADDSDNKEEKEKTIRIALESHGRESFIEGVDLSRTVGWFTTTYPVSLQLENSDVGSSDGFSDGFSVGSRLKSIKEQLRRMPDNGIGYGLLHYLADEATRQKLESFPSAEVLFNYLGRQQLDSQQNDASRKMGLRVLNNIDLGLLRAPQNNRDYPLEINAWVAEDQLRFNWTYDTQRYSADTIFAIARTCTNNLIKIIAHCVTTQRGGFTPSDFPDVNFDQNALDTFVSQLPKTVQTNIQSLYPLAPLQESFLWNSLQNGSQSGLLHMRGTLCGELDLSLLKQAWYQVIDRHPALRSAVHWEGLSQPLQLVEKRIELPWQVLDWRETTPKQVADRITELLEKDKEVPPQETGKKGFALSQSPLIRLTLIRTADLTCELIWTCHHLMIDGWSGTVVINQVLDCYDSLRQGHALPSSNVTASNAIASYQDYIRWRNHQSSTAAQQFWKAYLNNFTPAHWPNSASATPSPSSPLSSQSLQLTLNNKHTLPLQAFLRSHRLTFNTLIQATWTLLLYSRSGQHDLAFGATVSGRQADLPGIDSVVGLLINTLPVRIKIAADETVTDWLQSIQQQQAEANRYAYSSLNEIQTWSEQTTQLFNSLLVIENYPAREGDRTSGLQIENLRSGIVSAYGLTLVVKPGAQPTLIAESQTIDSEALSSLLSDFESLLCQIMTSTEVSLQQILPPVKKSDSQQMLSHSFQSTRKRQTNLPTIVDSTASLPRNVLEMRLSNIWKNVLDASTLTPEDSFFDLGGNSLLAVQLFNQMQQQLNCTLPLATLFRAPSIRQFAAILSQDQPVANWSSLVPIKTDGSRLPFFFHGGSADALTWARFASMLGDDQPFYALQRPDLSGYDTIHDTVEALAAACITEMKMVQPTGPYVIGGHCFGGTVAFEIAQQLIAAGDTIATLIAVDAYCPNVVTHTPLTSLQETLQLANFTLRKAYYYHAGKNLSQLPKKVKQRLFPPSPPLHSSMALPPSNGTTTQQQPSQQPGQPQSASAQSYQARYTRAHQASEVASDRYQPTTSSVPLHLFRAKTQLLDWHYGQAMGWQKVNSSKVAITTISGLFGNLFNQKSGPLLAKQVKIHLAKLPPPSS